MKNTDAVTSTRMRVLMVIIGLIVLIHVIVVLCVWVPHRKAESAASAAEEPAARTEQTAVPSGPTGTRGGILPAAVSSAQPAGNYRRPLSVSWLGKPLRYQGAVRGNLPYMPGGKLARSGILVDLTTRNVLWAKNERKAVPVASMAKMMTLLVAMENLAKHPEWNLDMPVTISRATMTQVPRSGVIWLDVRETLPLRSLMKAVSIKSANDAAYQVALTTGGDVESFVGQMNAKAALLGMAGTNFVNPHGLPNKTDKRNSTSSAEGMILLGERLLEYPDIMEWAGTQMTSIDRPMVKGGKTDLKNTNHLVVPRYPGVDGMKTGFTNAAGYCLTFTAVRNGKRLMGCVTGFPTGKERDIFARRILDWGYLRAAEMDAGKLTPPPAEKVYLPGTRPVPKAVPAPQKASNKKVKKR